MQPFLDVGGFNSIRVDHLPAAVRSLRIAIVTETYPPEVNGVAMTVARIVAGLHDRHHDLQLVRPRQTASDEATAQTRFHEVLMRGLPIPRYPHLRMGLPAKRALVKLWSTTRPDVVHIATEGPLGFSALQAAARLKLPVTSDFRTNFHAYSRHYGVGWMRTPIMAYLRRFHNAARVTMVPTDALRAELAAAGFRNVVVVARGVDTRRFDPARRSAALRASWAVDDGDPVALYVGRLAPEKNLDLVAASFESIRARNPRAKLVVVGDGPLATTFGRNTPGVVLAGRRGGDDLAAHYASTDLFLFPSLTETFGNVTLEAMASGLPVVAYDDAAAAQLIESGRNGVLVARGDAERFVREAAGLADDPMRRLAMGPAARALALRHSWDDVVARFETIVLRSMPANPGDWSVGVAATIVA
jgi:glycosyltransferase involved in cell wall biosynthesis